MLTAQLVKRISDINESIMIDQEIIKISKEIFEVAIDSKNRRHVCYEPPYVGSRVEIVVSKLQDMGFDVRFEQYPKDGYSEMVIRW